MAGNQLGMRQSLLRLGSRLLVYFRNGNRSLDLFRTQSNIEESHRFRTIHKSVDAEKQLLELLTREHGSVNVQGGNG